MRTRIHINLTVADLERSTAFYAALFAAQPSKIREDYANWRLDEPALHLALVYKPAYTQTSAQQHFGVELFDDAELDAWRQRVEAAGLAIRREEAVTCCYAVADKFWVADPEGNEWEFWVRHEEADSMHGEAMPLATQTDACCTPAVTPAVTPASQAPPTCCTPPTGSDDSGCC